MYFDISLKGKVKKKKNLIILLNCQERESTQLSLSCCKLFDWGPWPAVYIFFDFFVLAISSFTCFFELGQDAIGVHISDDWQSLSSSSTSIWKLEGRRPKKINIIIDCIIYLLPSFLNVHQLPHYCCSKPYTWVFNRSNALEFPWQWF